MIYYMANRIYDSVLELARIADLYNEVQHAMHWSLSHIVWEDGNYDKDSLKLCIKDCDKNTGNVDKTVTSIVKLSLELLLKVVEEEEMEE